MFSRLGEKRSLSHSVNGREGESHRANSERVVDSDSLSYTQCLGAGRKESRIRIAHHKRQQKQWQSQWAAVEREQQQQHLVLRLTSIPLFAAPVSLWRSP